MIRITLFFICLNTIVAHAQADKQIQLATLGKLQLNFSTVQQVNGYHERPVKAVVGYKPGEAFQLTAPFAAQSLQLLVANGALVKKGTPLLLLSGSEVHHFLEMLAAQKALYDMSALRYNKNKKLFKQKNISSDKWASIAKNYYQSKIDYGHLRHFNEFIHSIPSEDSIIIKSPLDGVFALTEPLHSAAEETNLGQILPSTSLRLKVQVSTDTASQVEALILSKCTLNIEQSNQISTGYFITLWSETIKQECDLLLGQTIQATPQLSIHAYKVPKSSVFTWHRSSYILIKTQQHLTPISITIIASNNSDYFIHAEDDLASSEVLRSSVSAVHGILLGMGGD